MILLNAPALDSAAIDGWSALVVCSLISLGLLFGIGKWFSELCAYLTKRHSGTGRALM